MIEFNFCMISDCFLPSFGPFQIIFQFSCIDILHMLDGKCNVYFCLEMGFNWQFLYVEQLNESLKGKAFTVCTKLQSKVTPLQEKWQILHIFHENFTICVLFVPFLVWNSKIFLVLIMNPKFSTIKDTGHLR